MRDILTGLTATLLAASEAIPDGLLDPAARLGATGVLGFALLWLICRTLPQYTKALDELRKALTSLQVHCAKTQAEKE